MSQNKNPPTKLLTFMLGIKKWCDIIVVIK